MRSSDGLFCLVLITTLAVINPVLAQGGYNYMDSYDDGSMQNIRIPIGLISDLDSDILRATFMQAIDTINAKLINKLVGIHREIGYSHSMLGVKYLCELMEQGVGAIFGPSALTTSRHLMSVCDHKDLPYIFSHMSETDEGFNLHPHPGDIAKALHSVISAFEWKRYLFLYENTEYLGVLNTLLTLYGHDSPIISVMRYDLRLNGNYKPVLRRVRKSLDNYIVVVGSTESVEELLKQAQQVGIMNDEYAYVIGSLDLQTFDFEEYRYSEVNITGFRLFSASQPTALNLIRALDLTPELVENPLDHEDEEEYMQLSPAEREQRENEKREQEMLKTGRCPITAEMALLYDGVVTFAETIKYMQYSPQSLNCTLESTTVKEDGSTFKNYMRSISIENDTISGRIFFDGSKRKGYTLEVIELQSAGLVKVGVWEENKNFTFERPIQPKQSSENALSMVNKTLTVLISVPNAPYSTLVDSPKKLEGNAMYQGYAVDLINELASKLGFNFTLKNGGTDYGTYNKTTNVTTGMIKDVVDGKADLVITDLTITSERQFVVDFTIPFMNTGISILYLKPQKSDPTTFSFMSPFSNEVWQYLGIAFLVVSFCYFLFGRLSPQEWSNPYPCIKNPERLENQYTLSNSIWFAAGSILQQGSEMAPRSLSTRSIHAIWCFFVLVVCSIYVGNLASSLTVENPSSPVKSIKDLAENNGGVQYGAKRNGATRSFFAVSEDEMYKKISEYMSSNPDLLCGGNEEGVERVKNSDVKSGKTYAFLMESTSIEYHTKRNCRLHKVGEPLDEKGYGIAMQKDWPHRDELSNALLELQEQGKLAKLKNKWWNEIGAGACDMKSAGDGVKPLSVDNLIGVYYVLIVGTAFSMLYGITCWCWRIGKKSHAYKVPFQAALWEEFKIAINITNTERPLKGATTIYSRSRNSSLDLIESFSTDCSDGNGDEEEDEETEEDKKEEPKDVEAKKNKKKNIKDEHDNEQTGYKDNMDKEEEPHKADEQRSIKEDNKKEKHKAILRDINKADELEDSK